ncbi:MAG: peptide chain release factor N(5)-glutamine methyltransferase [Betaproteobacteria bacterium]|nr:peptide chain release factor N(5)-glutamine methyltransferase [Betaproteobacteria bacterium]
MNVATALQGDPGTRLERRLLLEAATHQNHAWLLSRPEYRLSPAEAATYHQLLTRRAAGEPIAYLLGRHQFYGLELAVTPAVLIPRPETEGLVAWALEQLTPDNLLPVLDLGTGSGAIAIALHVQRPKLSITAVDVSAPALALARANAARWQATLMGPPIVFVQSHWFENLGTQRFGLILANPPYVAEGDPHLKEGDLRFEPRSALCAGPKGLDALQSIIEQAPRHLHPGGALLLEHGYDQGAACRALFEAAGFKKISTRPDLAGTDRLTGGSLYPLPPEQD